MFIRGIESKNDIATIGLTQEHIVKTLYPGSDHHTPHEMGVGSVTCLEITDTLGKTCIIK